MKKIILTAVFGCLATLFAVNANAQTSTKSFETPVVSINGTTYSSFAQALQYIWNHSEDELFVSLLTDIDMGDAYPRRPSISDFTTRPTDYAGFRGTFDGRNHTISNLLAATSLFGTLYGSVKNLTIDRAMLVASSTEPVALICDVCDENGTIEDVAITNSELTNQSGACNGIAGYLYGTISNTTFRDNRINITSSTAKNCGIAYIPDYTKGSVDNCSVGNNEGVTYRETNVNRWTSPTLNQSGLEEPADVIVIEAETTIPSGETVTFKNGMTIGFAAGGKLIVADGGNLINKTGTALTATMQKNVTKEKWNFIGLPIAAGEQGIGISPLANVEGDIWALQYKQGEWDENYLHWNETNKSYIKEGEGIFAWPDADYTLNIDGTLVNGDVTRIAVESKLFVQNFVALANPYPAAIKIADLVALNGVQGQVCYIYNGTSYDTPNTGTIPVGTGFFLNTAENITFTPSMIDGYTTTTAKSTPAERNFLTVSVSTNGYKVPVMFAKNEAATAEYDIFDANKMFGDGTVAEPYLICNDINLCKEEVNALPYTATMNIKSGEAQSVEIIAENIPEGYSLTLIDNEEEIVMNQGDVYTVNIASGENADRFKLKIGEKNVSITDVEVAEAPSIRNNNRNIIIEGGKNIKAEVYNTLGQKVYETTKRNFSLEGVEAGAYVVKVQSGNAVQSHKMIIR